MSDLQNMARVTSFVAGHVLDNAREYANLMKLSGYHALPPDHAELLNFCIYPTEEMNRDLEKLLGEAWEKTRTTAPQID